MNIPIVSSAHLLFYRLLTLSPLLFFHTLVIGFTTLLLTEILPASESTDSTTTLSASHEVKNKPYIYVLYGPPGSGRAKIAVKLNQRFSVPKISFAELLARALQEDSPVGKRAREYMRVGGEIPLDLFWMILEQRMNEKDCAQGSLWEGIPTTVEQTQLIIDKLSSSFNFLVVSIDASDDWLIERVQGRLYCSSCGRVYHDPHSSPRKEGICDICGHKLQRRTDDSPDTIRSRVQVYEQSIAPVLEIWGKEDYLKEVSGNRPLEEIYTDIASLVIQAQNSK